MLKKTLLILLVVILVAGGYFLSIMYTTGYFREIESVSFGEVFQEIPLAGAEDITADYESNIMIISAFDRSADKRGESPTGGLYIVDLLEQPFKPVRLSDGLGSGFHPHGISLYKLDSGKYQLLVVNHQNGKQTIEQFELNLPNELVHERTYDDPSIVSPNDIIALDADRFYFTNDHKNTEGLALIAENYLGLALSNTLFFDGSGFREVAGAIQYANGITISPDRKDLYVAAPRGFKILKYEILEEGYLGEPETIPAKTGVDNMEWDEDGNLWIGCHPDLLTFSSYAGLKRSISPSEVLKIQGDKIETVYMNDGKEVSASTVAVPYKEYLFIGTVMDNKLLVLKRP